MSLSIAQYSALTSNIYHFDDADQQLQLGDIKPGLLSYTIPEADRAPLLAAGFTFAEDGFIYTPRGMGARVVVDGAGNYTIVYRGTDAGSVSFPNLMSTTPPRV